MKVSFKDVGQGDSIILEWEEESGTKVGIIDCNLKGKKNPVLNYIQENGYEEIAFIILSHPHEDHYSGMLSLLDYIEERGIIIQKVAHTLTHIGQEFWQYFERSEEGTQRLHSLVKKWTSLKKKDLIKRMTMLSDGVEIIINNSIKIKCLAPSHDDIESYMHIVNAESGKDNVKYKRQASKAANLLSTILKLSIGDSYILFTADAESITFKRIIDRGEFDFSSNKFSICQVPHHGSEKNHYDDFWDLIETLETKYAVISAGEQKKYNHPSYKVIQSFHQLGYLIKCTSIINGMREYVEKMKEISLRSTVIGTGSTSAEEYESSKDQVFILKNGLFDLELKK